MRVVEVGDAFAVALSNAPVLHAIGKKVNWAETTIELGGSPLRDASFTQSIYAADLRSITCTGDSSSDLGVHAEENERFAVTASVLAPRNAVLGVVPTTEGVAVGQLESSDAPLARLPEGTPNFRDIRLELAVVEPQQKKYIALNLIDLNPQSGEFGRNPINPIACMCLPLGYIG